MCVFQIVARVSVDNRTRALVQALQRASDVRLCVRRVEELSLHLLEFPETRSVAVKVRKHFLLDQLSAQRCSLGSVMMFMKERRWVCAICWCRGRTKHHPSLLKTL